jgi:hypothetical protein
MSKLTAKRMAQLVERAFGDECHKFPSSRGEPDKYTLIISAADGKMSCDCRGWTMKKPDRPRFCNHCLDHTRKHHLDLVACGDYVYKVGATGSLRRIDWADLSYFISQIPRVEKAPGTE